jgi:hypothetical protein
MTPLTVSITGWVPPWRRGGEPVFENYLRDVWYLNVLHFAAPVEVDSLLAFCDLHRDHDFGETLFTAAELVHYRFENSAMRAIPLHTAHLTPQSQ